MLRGFKEKDKGPKIKKLLEQKYHYEDIAFLCSCSNTSIANVKKAMDNNREIPVICPSTFKKTTPKRVIIYIIDRTLADPRLSCECLANEILDKLDFEISRSTVNRVRHDERFTRKAPRYIQKLSMVQKDKRTAFCYTLLALGIPLNKLVFSDESRFVFHDDSGTLWRRYGDDNEAAQCAEVKFDQGLMVYAAIGIGFKSKLVIISTNVDQYQYWLNLNESGMFDLDPDSYYFVQDGAAAHTAKQTMKFLETRCNTLSWWPANSPDLNPIEHLWAIMKRIVRTYLRHWSEEEKGPLTKEILAQMIQSAWDSISQETIDKLVDSFEKRIVICASRKGASLNGHFHDQIDAASLPACPVPELLRTVNKTVQFIDRTKPPIDIPEGLHPVPLKRVEKQKGPWREAELQLLNNLAQFFNKKWTTIALYIGRTAEACRKKHESFNIPVRPLLVRPSLDHDPARDGPPPRPALPPVPASVQRELRAVIAANPSPPLARPAEEWEPPPLAIDFTMQATLDTALANQGPRYPPAQWQQSSGETPAAPWPYAAVGHMPSFEEFLAMHEQNVLPF